MTDESDDRSFRIRAASHRVMGAIAVAASPGGIASWEAAATALFDALTIVDTKITPERDERTRDLEELIKERDAIMAEKDRQILRADRILDERDAERRATAAAAMRTQQAEDELEKTRTLVDELREQLTAPTVLSAAVKAWVDVDAGSRAMIIRSIRTPATGSAWNAAADVLESPSAHDRRVRQ